MQGNDREAHAQGVRGEQPSPERRGDAGKGFQGFQRLDAPDDSRMRAQDARRGGGVFLLHGRFLRKEAAVASRAFVGGEHGRLADEAFHGAVHQRDAEGGTGVRQGKACRVVI